MKPITIVMIEDSQEFADALKKVLAEQKKFPCEVIVLNPDRPELPTFEQFHDEIQSHLRGFRNLVLMDKQLGKWKWTGAHLAPSFHKLVAISTDEMPWAEFNFTGKAMIAFHNKEDAKTAFVETILKAIEQFMPSEIIQELVEYQRAYRGNGSEVIT